MTTKIYPMLEKTVDCGSIFGGRFKADLMMAGDSKKNHILKITMRVRFTQKQTMALSYDDAPPQSKDQAWNNHTREFDTFKENFKKIGVSAWHRRLCLIPPDNANFFKVSEYWGLGTSYMPNVECHFELQESGTEVDWDVDVLKAPVQIADEASTSRLRVGVESNQIKDNVRSLDGKTYTQNAIAHEIGHMLGQPHAGSLSHDTNCKRAISPDWTLGKEPDDYAYVVNTHNALACYGEYRGKAVPGVTENIMGIGSSVTKINAISWQKALEKTGGSDAKLPGWGVEEIDYKPPRKL